MFATKPEFDHRDPNDRTEPTPVTCTLTYIEVVCHCVSSENNERMSKIVKSGW